MCDYLNLSPSGIQTSNIWQLFGFRPLCIRMHQSASQNLVKVPSGAKVPASQVVFGEKVSIFEEIGCGDRI